METSTPILSISINPKPIDVYITSFILLAIRPLRTLGIFSFFYLLFLFIYFLLLDFRGGVIFYIVFLLILAFISTLVLFLFMQFFTITLHLLTKYQLFIAQINMQFFEDKFYSERHGQGIKSEVEYGAIKKFRVIGKYIFLQQKLFSAFGYIIVEDKTTRDKLINLLTSKITN